MSKRPDPVGAGLSILGMGLLLWGIIEAPSRTWTSLVVVGSIAAAVVVITAFIAWERRSTHAMLELSFFASRQFSVAMGAMGLVIFALMGGLFVLTQYLQFSLGTALSRPAYEWRPSPRYCSWSPPSRRCSSDGRGGNWWYSPGWV